MIIYFMWIRFIWDILKKTKHKIRPDLIWDLNHVAKRWFKVCIFNVQVVFLFFFFWSKFFKLSKGWKEWMKRWFILDTWNILSATNTETTLKKALFISLFIFISIVALVGSIGWIPKLFIRIQVRLPQVSVVRVIFLFCTHYTI